MASAIGNLVAFIGAICFIYGLFEVNKFLGVGLLLVSSAQLAIRYANEKKD